MKMSGHAADRQARSSFLNHRFPNIALRLFPNNVQFNDSRLFRFEPNGSASKIRLYNAPIATRLQHLDRHIRPIRNLYLNLRINTIQRVQQNGHIIDRFHGNYRKICCWKIDCNDGKIMDNASSKTIGDRNSIPMLPTPDFRSRHTSNSVTTTIASNASIFQIETSI